MSLLDNYTVGKVVNPFLWEDGKYLVENTFVGEKKGDFGNYISVEWFDQEKQRNLFETFNIASTDENIRQWQLSEWNKFLQQVAGLKEGEPYHESKVYGKKCWITVKTHTNKNTGKTKSIVVHREPVDESTGDYPVSIPALNVSTSAALNDEVPF